MVHREAAMLDAPQTLGGVSASASPRLRGDSMKILIKRVDAEVLR